MSGINGHNVLSNGGLRAALLEKLAGSGLTAAEAKKLHLTTMTAVEVAKLQLPPYAAFRIPYFDLKGKQRKFFRLRYLEQTLTGFAAQSERKALRYVQPAGTVNDIYLPPFINWQKTAATAEAPIIITEGELKAACSTLHGLPTIGLGGVWSFKSTRNLLPYLPVFKEFKWQDRPVYIIYDSDAASNGQVMLAEQALCRVLMELGARPRIVRLPSLCPPEKTGLDDFLVSEGAKQLVKLMHESEPFKMSEVLHEINTLVAYARNPGLVVKLENMQRMSAANFKEHAFSTWKHPQMTLDDQGNEKMKEVLAAPAWLKWKGRHEVEQVTYAPGQSRHMPGGVLNAWPGWGVVPRPGDIKPWKELLDFLFAEDPPAARKWFEQWCAYPLQHPGVKMYSAAVLWGITHGTGKSIIGYTLQKIYGRNATEVHDQHLHGDHNEWAENKQFVFGDEITGGDKRGSADRLKSMITQKEIRLNPKYVPSYTVPDCINYFFTSNHPDAFFLEETDRRFFIHEVQGAPQPMAFYRRYDAWLHGEGPAFLFNHLLHLNLEGFEPRAPALRTRARDEMIADNRSDLETWVRHLLEQPDQVLRLGESQLPGDLWTAGDLLKLYDPLAVRKATPAAMGRALKRGNVCRPAHGKPFGTSAGSMRLFAVRNTKRWGAAGHTECVKHYEATRGNGAMEAPPAKGKKF